MRSQKSKRILAITLMIVMVFSIAITANAATGTWKKDSKGWWFKYSEGGYPKAAWEKIGSKWYHFDASGYMQTGWIKDGGKWYYLGTDGVMKTGWQKVSGKWYYLGTDGAMKTGWQKISKKWYYLNKSGIMQTGWLKSGGKWYYLGTDGIMKTGWQKISGDWYYLESSGVMHTGWLKSGGKWYYLGDNTGIMLTGKVTLGGKTYIFASNGVLQSGSGSTTYEWSDAIQHLLFENGLNDFGDKSSYLNYNQTHKGTALFDADNDGTPELLIFNGLTNDFNLLMYTYPGNVIFEFSNMGTISYDTTGKVKGFFAASPLSASGQITVKNLTFDGEYTWWNDVAILKKDGTADEVYSSQHLEVYRQSTVLPFYSFSDIKSMGWNAFLAKYGY